jgi:crossover junction endodeoxyribonuclease RusA
MATLQLVLPLPPSINSQYVTVGRKRVLSKEAKTYKSDVKKQIDRLVTSGQIPPSVEHELRGALLGVYITFYFETPFRRDLDGGLKIALDSVCMALGVDDRMVVDIHLIKQMDTLNPRMEMEIETITDWQFDPQYVVLMQADDGEAAESDGLE